MCIISPHFIRHLKSSPNVTNAPIPPVDFMSSTLGPDLGATLLSEEDEEEEERYAVVSKNLSGFEYTPSHSVDNLEGSGKSRTALGRWFFFYSFLNLTWIPYDVCITSYI